MPMPKVAKHLVCSKCGARNTDISAPIWARPDARVGDAKSEYPDVATDKIAENVEHASRRWNDASQRVVPREDRLVVTM